MNSKAVKQNTPKKSERTTPKNKKLASSKTAARSSKSDALSPVALGSGQSLLPPSRVSEEFRWGEFSDTGQTVLDGPSTFNQILFSVPVNPRRILSFAKTNTIGSTDPMIYKSEPEIQNAYQYEIDSCTLKATCVVPDTVSFTLALFITPNLESVIDSSSVMNIFASLPSSAKREISVKGDTSLTFRSGRAYIKDDPLDSQFDPRLCFGGYIVGFLKAPCVAGLASDASRAYLGPICTVSLQSNITYYGFQYNGSTLDSPQLFTAVDSEVSITNNGSYSYGGVYQYDNAGVPTDYTVPLNITMVSVSIPEELEDAVIASSQEQQRRGEILGSTGDNRSVVTPLTLGARPIWEPITNDSLDIASSFDEVNRSSIIDGLKSAFAYIKDIPNQVKAGLTSLLGKQAGDAVFKVGSSLAMLGFKVLTGLRDGSQAIPPPPMIADAVSSGWTAQGLPRYVVGTGSGGAVYSAPTSWWLLPGSSIYYQAIENLPDSQKSTAQSLLDDPYGPQPMIWSQCSASYLTDNPDAFTGGPAFIGRPGIVSFWEQILPSGSLVKNTFGQPLQVAGSHPLIEARSRSRLQSSFTSRRFYNQLRRKRYGLLHLSVTPLTITYSNGDTDIPIIELPSSIVYSRPDRHYVHINRCRVSNMAHPDRPGVMCDFLHVPSILISIVPTAAVSSTGILPSIDLTTGDYVIEFSYFEENGVDPMILSLVRRPMLDSTPISDTVAHPKRDENKLVHSENPPTETLQRILEGVARQYSQTICHRDLRDQ